MPGGRGSWGGLPLASGDRWASPSHPSSSNGGVCGLHLGRLPPSLFIWPFLVFLILSDPQLAVLALSYQALLFALTLARAGRIQGESLAAWASVGPRVGSPARWHLLHKLPLARPCGSQSNPLLPAGPHPSSAEPGLLLGSCTLPEGLLPPCCFPKLTRFPERLWGGKKRVSVSVTGKQGARRGHFLAPRPHPNIL